MDRPTGLWAYDLERHTSIASGVDFFIFDGDVRLYEKTVDARSIQATGKLSVENNLSLANVSFIENLSLQANLTVGDNLFLTRHGEFMVVRDDFRSRIGRQ